MPDFVRLKLREPYLVMIGDVLQPMYAKTGFGIVDWRRERVLGQLRFDGCPVDLGVPDLSVDEAARAGVGSIVIGVAPVGGVIPDSWLEVLCEAARAGLDVVSGLHVRLGTLPGLAEAAAAGGGRLVDVRVPPPGIPVGSGRRRTGRRLLTVGTDCAVGKKYTALCIEKAMREAGWKATFRATGQTGIMIAGEGLPIDAVVSDFVSGAAELLSPDNAPEHWDVIEGQGSLFHPGYAAVSLGLLHGSQPDAVVVCHDAARTAIDEWPGYALPSLEDCIAEHLALARLTNPQVECAGISVNTSGMQAAEHAAYVADVSSRTGLPCVNPLRDGVAAILERLRERFP